MKLFMHVKIWQKNELLKKGGPQIRFCLFTFRLIALKQLNAWQQTIF